MVFFCIRLHMPSPSSKNIAYHAIFLLRFRLLLSSNYGRIPAPPTQTNTSTKLWLANCFISLRPSQTLRMPLHYPVGLHMVPRFFINKLLSTLLGTSLKFLFLVCGIHRGRILNSKGSLMQTILAI